MRALGWICIFFFALLVFITVWQVFARQVLNSPSTWSEELAKITFVWLSFLGAVYVLGERGHIAVDFAVRKTPIALQKITAIIVELTTFFFAIVALLIGGYYASSIAWGQNLTALPLSIGWVYLVMPISGVLMALFSIIDVIEIMRGQLSPYADENAVIESALQHTHDEIDVVECAKTARLAKKEH